MVKVVVIRWFRVSRVSAEKRRRKGVWKGEHHAHFIPDVCSSSTPHPPLPLSPTSHSPSPPFTHLIHPQQATPTHTTPSNPTPSISGPHLPTRRAASRPITQRSPSPLSPEWVVVGSGYRQCAGDNMHTCPSVLALHITDPRSGRTLIPSSGKKGRGRGAKGALGGNTRRESSGSPLWRTALLCGYCAIGWLEGEDACQDVREDGSGVPGYVG